MSNLYQPVDVDEPVSDKLSDKQIRLVDEYMVDLNKAAAFRRAGYKWGDDDRRNRLRVNIAFKSRAVIAEIRRRQEEARLEMRHLPLDVMYSNLDFWVKQMGRYDPQNPEELPAHVNARAQAQVVAVAAAPYVHPKLNAVAVRAQAPGDDARLAGGTILLKDGPITADQALSEYMKMLQFRS